MLNIGLAALAVPVIDFSDRLQGALTLLGPNTAVRFDMSSPQTRELEACAAAISERLGRLKAGT
jgi:DNA-binding IclR family transcriptional regulator